MRSLSILILGSAMMMMMEVEATPGTYLVETADADEPVYNRAGIEVIFIHYWTFCSNNALLTFRNICWWFDYDFIYFIVLFMQTGIEGGIYLELWLPIYIYYKYVLFWSCKGGCVWGNYYLFTYLPYICVRLELTKLITTPSERKR